MTTVRAKTRGRGRKKSDGPDPVDIHVGGRVRLRRTLLGLSQEKLGDALGLTFQQVQKYERGANRMGASRLHQMGQILDVPVSFFFDEMTPAALTRSTQFRPTETAGGDDRERDPMAKRETLELVRAYYRISDPRLRKRVFELTKAAAKAIGPR